METQKLLVALIAIFNEAAASLEKLKSATDEGEEAPAKNKSRAKAKAKEDEEEEEEEEAEDDIPTVTDVKNAAKEALKVLERDDVVKLVKKVGKAETSGQIAPENRRKFLDALQAALDDAEA